MTEEGALANYESLERAGVIAWIDGGFCVDALIGEIARAMAGTGRRSRGKFAAALDGVRPDCEALCIR